MEESRFENVKRNAVYDCKLVYDYSEAVWKQFRPYSDHLELPKSSLCIVMKQLIKIDDIAIS